MVDVCKFDSLILLRIGFLSKSVFDFPYYFCYTESASGDYVVLILEDVGVQNGRYHDLARIGQWRR